MAIINLPIPTANFEWIRDRIGYILAEEFGYQYTLTANEALNATIWVERTTPFDKTELPAINVQLMKSEYDQRDQKQVQSENKFLITIYAKATSTESEEGSLISLLNVQKMMRMVRAIIQHPGYRTLYADGTNPLSVRSINFTSQVMPDEKYIADSTNTRMSFLELVVSSIERVELANGLPCLSVGTLVKVNETELGYRYEYGVGEGLIVAEDETPNFALQYFISENGGDMAVIKVSMFDTAENFDTDSLLTGIQQSGSTYNNVNFTYGQVAALVTGSSKIIITVPSDGNTITNAFFDGQTISIIYAYNQTYLVGQDFTQTGDTITATSFGFFAGQTIIAQL